MIKIFKRKSKAEPPPEPPKQDRPPATVDPLRQPKVTGDGWTLIHYGGPPYGYDTEYYANEAPLDEHHTLLRLVPHSACKHKYRKIPNHGVMELVKFDPPDYDRVTVEIIRHKHSKLWECDLAHEEQNNSRFHTWVSTK